MNTSVIITQIKTLHDTVQTVAAQTQGAGQNGAYAHGARTALSTAINQLMLHQYWIEPEIAAAQAVPPPTANGGAEVPLSPNVPLPAPATDKS